MMKCSRMFLRIYRNSLVVLVQIVDTICPKYNNSVCNTVNDTPIEAQRLAVQCYINLENYHESTRAMLNPEFMQELLNILQVWPLTSFY